jgi:hypothetical protein
VPKICIHICYRNDEKCIYFFGTLCVWEEGNVGKCTRWWALGGDVRTLRRKRHSSITHHKFKSYNPQLSVCSVYF